MRLIVDHSERDAPGEVDMLDHYPVARIFAQSAKVEEVTVRFTHDGTPPYEVTWARVKETVEE